MMKIQVKNRTDATLYAWVSIQPTNLADMEAAAGAAASSFMGPLHATDHNNDYQLVLPFVKGSATTTIFATDDAANDLVGKAIDVQVRGNPNASSSCMISKTFVPTTDKDLVLTVEYYNVLRDPVALLFFIFFVLFFLMLIVRIIGWFLRPKSPQEGRAKGKSK